MALRSNEKRILAILENADWPITLQKIKSQCKFTRGFTPGKVIPILKRLIISRHIQAYAFCSTHGYCFRGVKLAIYTSMKDLEKKYKRYKGDWCTHNRFTVAYISRKDLMPTWAIQCDNNMKLFHLIIQLKLYVIRFRKRYWCPMGKGGKQTISHLVTYTHSPQKACAIHLVKDIFHKAIHRNIQKILN